MKKESTFLSVCIPAYNRSSVLSDLLDSILRQSFADFDIVICEDNSRERPHIAAIIRQYQERYPDRISYFENEKNLGYDGNIRELIRKATGTFCVFMGNDDILAPDGLNVIARTLKAHPDAGVFLRTYAAFNGTTDHIDQVFRYFPHEVYAKPGADAISLFFRRSVVIPGMTLHRETSLRLATTKFDGSLLYQLYLVGNILATKAGVFSPDVVTLYRNGGIPEFGNAEAEKGKFVPEEHTPESSLHFMESMLSIAKSLDRSTGYKVSDRILTDMANYSYPFIAIQTDKGKIGFIRYVFALAKLGFARSPMYWIYSVALLTLGSGICDSLIRWIKKRHGSTPKIGFNLSRSQS